MYARFRTFECTLLDSVAQTLRDEFGPTYALTHSTAAPEPAHITVLYGPELPENTVEATSREEARAVLGGLDLDAYAAMSDRVVAFRGVSHFDRRSPTSKEPTGSFIIKAEFTSPFLTAMRTDLWRRLSGMEARRSAELATLRSAGDADDATYALPPVRWAHATLFVAKPDTPGDVLLRIEERARALLVALPSTVTLENIDLMSAKTWTCIPLL